jgi:hypothetical protein
MPCLDIAKNIFQWQIHPSLLGNIKDLNFGGWTWAREPGLMRRVVYRHAATASYETLFTSVYSKHWKSVFDFGLNEKTSQVSLDDN